MSSSVPASRQAAATGPVALRGSTPASEGLAISGCSYRSPLGRAWPQRGISVFPRRPERPGPIGRRPKRRMTELGQARKEVIATGQPGRDRMGLELREQADRRAELVGRKGRERRLWDCYLTSCIARMSPGNRSQICGQAEADGGRGRRGHQPGRRRRSGPAGRRWPAASRRARTIAGPTLPRVPCVTLRSITTKRMACSVRLFVGAPRAVRNVK